jgi:flagellar motor switch protein FliN
MLVRDDVHAPKKAEAVKTKTAAKAGTERVGAGTERAATDTALTSGIPPGIDLLLDVELEATLRFGSRELPLGELLELGPGDVVQLDRHVSDPVDLIVADKIVARGDVVLVNGNFGLRVTEVAEPRPRLEAIRCLF